MMFVTRWGWGYSIYPWVGRCGPAPHTLTLFKTKIADFPTLFKTTPIIDTQFKTFNPKDLVTICCSIVRRTYVQAVYRPRKNALFKTKIDKIDILIKTKNDKIDTLFKTKIPKNIPWLAAPVGKAL